MNEQERYPLAKIDFEAIRRTAERLGYSKELGSRIERALSEFEGMTTYGDVINAYLQRKQMRKEAKERAERLGRKLCTRRDPVGCERLICYRNFGKLSALVMNEHLREMGIRLD
jgi:hypothetical protein